MELDHASHPDHKLSYKISVKRGKKLDYCAACRYEISSEHYSCSECNLFLHKLCAERPQVLTHSLHPLHPLRLHHKSPYDDDDDGEYPECDACEKGVEGFVYHCAICNFDLDIICAFPDGLKLNHVCHPHILTLEKVVKRGDKGVVCAACLEGISGPLADYYSCRKCNFFLHKLCAQRPPELIHPLHPIHTLNLIQEGSYRKGTYFCNICEKQIKGFIYNCQHCKKFNLDFKCAFPKPENRIQNLEQVHQHPLTFNPRTSKFSCDLCSSTAGDEGEEEQSYACSTCDFMIHRSCAFRELTQKYEHKHPLSLVQGVPEDLQI